jgi:hypothetical protein
MGSLEKGIYEDIFIPSNFQTLVPNLKSYFLKPEIVALVPIWDGWQVAGGQKMISLSDIALSLWESWIGFGSVFLVGFWDLLEQS